MAHGLKALAAVGICLLAPHAATAVTIEFRHGGVASGSIGGTAFVDAEYQIRALGDTDDRVSYAPDGNVVFYSIDHLSAWIQIKGIGNADILSPTRTFSNIVNDVVGFSRGGLFGADLIIGPLIGAYYPDWDMLSSVAEVSTVAFFDQWGAPWDPVMTDLGQLTFAEGQINEGTTFRAIRRGVPEPGTFALLGLGLAGLGLSRRRRAN